MLLASGDTQRVAASGIPGTIHTVAGGGVGDGGAAIAAALYSPRGVALDPAGDLYIADHINCRVRRVSGGVISTVAGTGVCGYAGDGGAATNAALYVPAGVALDTAGDLYIADLGNCRVRKVSGGVITTVAGTGVCSYGGDGGAATAAALYYPQGVTLDAAGDLYIADRGNCRVRRVAGGAITTVAGTGACAYSGDGGAAGTAELNYPYSVALDGAGNLYIADAFNCRVRRVSGGVITTVAGAGICGYSGDGGTATVAELNHPTGVALDPAGNLYIADVSNCRVRQVSGGVITTVAGTGTCAYSGDGGAATGAAVWDPWGVALDAAGDLYIADAYNCRVRRVSGGVITTEAGTGQGVQGTGICLYGGDGGAANAAALNGPHGVVLGAAGDLYFADKGNCRVRWVSGGVITTVAGTGVCGYSGDGGAATASALSSPRGVAVDASGLYIADRDNCRVRKVSDGIMTTVAGTGTCTFLGDGGPASAALVSYPQGVALDAAGGLYIADSGNCRVRRVSGGIITTVAGTGVCSLSGDGGAATAAALNQPFGVALDAAGALYIADSLNCRVRRVSGGVITTVAGGQCGYLGDGGAAIGAGLYYPTGVALDAAGDLYIADTGSCRVRRVSGGIITTVAGGGGYGICSPYSGDGGAATAATLADPSGVALDAAGDLYIGDTGNNRVRIVHTSPCPFDLSNNGTVAFSDLLIFAQAYNSTPPDPNWNPDADFNQSGQVGFADLLLFADRYNDPAPNCPP